jgi:predicted nucleic acid-binding protein
MNIVIDTDIFIDFLRGYEPSKNWFDKLQTFEVLISVITEAELLSGKGCKDPEALRKTSLVMQIATKLIVDSAIAKKAGELQRNLDIPFSDSIIAATALLNNAKLITRNLKDYKRIKNLESEAPY